MKTAFTYLLLFFCGLTGIVISWEGLTTLIFQRNLETDSLGLGNNTVAREFAEEDSKYLSVERKAANKRRSVAIYESSKLLIFTLSLWLFLNIKGRKAVKSVSRHRLTVTSLLQSSSQRIETNFLSIVICTLIGVCYGVEIWEFLRSIFKNQTFLAILFVAGICLLLIPIVILFSYNLFRAYGVKTILILYVAYFIKLGTDFLDLEEVDLERMKKVSPEVFSDTVRKYLKETGLYEKVYEEREKGKSLNAALVGWGPREHIEIYGDFGKFKTEEFEAIMMHEIGHSKDKSLFKKMLMLFIIKWIEMLILVVLFTKVSDKYTDENITVEGVFLILSTIYFLALSKWVSIFYRLVSQSAEIASDLIAKSKGYGDDLAKVLYKITIASSDYINTTYMYNAMRSFHPTILNRIKYLTS